MSSDSFKMLPTNYSFTNFIYLTYMYSQDLVLKIPQGLICRQTNQLTNQPYRHFHVDKSIVLIVVKCI